VRRSSVAVRLVPEAQPEPAEPPLSHDPRELFADLLRERQTAMVLDREGLVLAGAHVAADGRDVGPEVGASLSGVSDEAFRATRHLGIGAWRAIVFETEAAVVALAPAPAGDSGDGLLVLAAPPTTPLGLLRRMLDRFLHRVTLWHSVRRP
jgi:predicted regulator of Ras-like GTPase activity (Roadblock/LC7/MglB family)